MAVILPASELMLDDAAMPEPPAKMMFPPLELIGPAIVRMSVVEVDPDETAVRVRLPPELTDALLLIVIGLCAVISKVPDKLSTPFTTIPPVLSITTLPALFVNVVIVNGAEVLYTIMSPETLFVPEEIAPK